MRTCRRPIIPAAIRLILLLAGICYFAPEGAAGQANILQCQRPHTTTGNPCKSRNPFTFQGLEPSVNLGAGNPVNLATGNKYIEMTDLPPTEDGLQLLRSYNAMDPGESALGPGWRHNLISA